MVEFGEEHADAFLLIFLPHALYGEFHDVDGGEGEVATPDGGLRTEAVLEHTGAAAHRGHLVLVAQGVVGLPLIVLVERGVEIEEIGEETACRHLAGEGVEVEVAVFGQVVHPPFLFPNLYGEDGGLAAAHALVGGEEYLAHHAAPLGRGVRAIVDGREHHLVATARVDGVHVVDKGLHRLVHAPYGLVHGMLLGALLPGQSVERSFDVVDERLIVEVLVTLSVEFFQVFQFLDVCHAHVGCQVEVEGRDGLSAVHLVLGALHRDTSQHRGGLDALGRARGAMSGDEAAGEDMVEGVLHAGERLGGVIVFVVDVEVVVLHGLAALLGEQVVVDEGFRGLRGKLHHHACRGVGIHVGILTGDIVVLDVDDVEEHVAGLGLAGNGALVAVGDELLRHILAARLHQFHLHGILYLLHRHLALALLCDIVGDFIYQALIFTLVGVKHGFADSRHDLLLVEAHDASVTLYYGQYHLLLRHLVVFDQHLNSANAQNRMQS